MLDLRWPIGYFFLVNSVLLVAYGLIVPVSTAVGTASINLNVVWGLVLGVFGLIMLSLAHIEHVQRKKHHHKI